MSFIADVMERIGESAYGAAYQALFFSDKCAYFEGVKTLKISDNEIRFSAGKKVLTVSGCNLRVMEAVLDCVTIAGSIKSFVVEER